MMCAFFSAIYSIQPKPLIDLWGVVPVASWGMMASGIAGLFLANPIVTAEGLDAKAWLDLYRFSRNGLGILVIFGLFEVHFSGHCRSRCVPRAHLCLCFRHHVYEPETRMDRVPRHCDGDFSGIHTFYSF